MSSFNGVRAYLVNDLPRRERLARPHRRFRDKFSLRKGSCLRGTASSFMTRTATIACLYRVSGGKAEC